MICPVCHKSIKPGLDITHGCGHQSHALCLDQANPNFDQCAKCLNPTVELTLKQPTSLNGRDYVTSPANRIWSKITRKVEKLNSQLPLQHLMAEYNYDLQYLLSQGVTLDELLNSGYTVDDLELYDDFAGRNGQRRSKHTLISLGVEARHFREHPQLLSKLEHPKDLITDFGLYFPDKDCLPLSVYDKEPEQPYTLVELCNMGWTSKELFGAGLDFIEQYQDLEPDRESERKMGISKKDIEQLPSYTEREVVYDTREPEVIIINRTAPTERQVERVNKPRRYHGLKKK